MRDPSHGRRGRVGCRPQDGRFYDAEPVDMAGGFKRERERERDGVGLTSNVVAKRQCSGEQGREDQASGRSEAAARKQQLTELDRPLHPEFIATRPGPGGTRLQYLTSHDAVWLANQEFDNDRWTSEISNVSQRYEKDKDGKHLVSVTVLVKVTVFWPGGHSTSHMDVGFGGGKPMQRCGEAEEQAYKEAVTDGLKRALRLFGEALGNCLYDKKYLDWTRMNAAQLKEGSPGRQWSVENLTRLRSWPVDVQGRAASHVSVDGLLTADELDDFVSDGDY